MFSTARRMEDEPHILFFSYSVFYFFTVWIGYENFPAESTRSIVPID